MSAKSDEQSAKRTDWSQDRTLLSNERTFSSWMGTGLACVGVALGMKAVFGAFEPTWLAKLAASIFLIVSVGLFYSAQSQACKTHKRLTETDAEALPPKSFKLIAIVMSLGSILTGIILWLI